MMRSATAFLPPSMITFMNLDSSTLPNLGSGRISRLGTSRRRGIFSPLSLLQLASFQTPREPISGLSLTRPAQNTCVWGHYAAIPRHAEKQHRKFLKNQGLFGLWLLRTVLGA